MALWKKKLATVMLISGDRLTVVQGQDDRVDYFNSTEILWSDREKAREGLLKIFPSARRRQAAELCLVLPRMMFFSKQIRLPSIDEEELHKMAALQISQHLPYPVEQAAWDLVVSLQRASSSDVLLLAIQLESVMKYLRPLSAAGITPTQVTISSDAASALLGSMDLTLQKVLFLPEEQYSEFCFCTSDNNFYFSRGIVYGHQDFQTDKLKDFFTQVRLTFESHRKSFPQSAISAGYYLQGFAKEFPQDFLETLSQESGVIWKELPIDHLLKSFAPGRSQSLPSSSNMVAGLAMLRRGFDKMCNFLPREYKTRNIVKAVRRNMVAISLLVFGVIIATTLAVTAPVVKKWEYGQKLDQQLRLIEKPFLKSRKEQALWTAITQSLEERVSPLKLVEQIYGSTPEGIVFTRIQITGRNDLQLEGHALQSSAVNDLQEKMIVSPLFRDVRLERSTRRAGPTGETVQFIITAKLQNASRAKETP